MVSVVSGDENGRGAVWCDPCIADIVAALNAAGIATTVSCCGHGRRLGNITLRDGREIFLPRDRHDAQAIEHMFTGDINAEHRAAATKAPT